jgi:hypothetical protein
MIQTFTVDMCPHYDEVITDGCEKEIIKYATSSHIDDEKNKYEDEMIEINHDDYEYEILEKYRCFQIEKKLKFEEETGCLNDDELIEKIKFMRENEKNLKWEEEWERRIAEEDQECYSPSENMVDIADDYEIFDGSMKASRQFAYK